MSSSKKFDPNSAASPDSGVFGLPFTEAEAQLVFLPIPWEATTSYGGGTSEGPGAILEASKQVDLFDLDTVRPYEPGLHMLEESTEIRSWNKEAKELASKIIDVGGDIAGNSALEKALERVNVLGTKLNSWVEVESARILKSGKILALVGGDHSVPLGAFQAIAKKYPSYGILHFDAHSDTRDAYEGFQWSHASIMRNALDHVPQIKRLVQVGIRDVCEEEIEYCRTQGDRVSVFFDRDLQLAKQAGRSWSDIAKKIVADLPNEVWISFDIDGLDPRFCPNTGTPVPGGLEFQEANLILRELVQSGKKIIGFDLNEVAPDLTDRDDEWDANVGARMLYKLSGWTLASRGLVKIQETRVI
jgi:agmatinase